MDDEDIYGKEFYRLNFSKAVEQKLLSDYKVLILTVREDTIDDSLRNKLKQFSGDIELDLSDAVKLIGCWRGLAGEIMPEDADINENLPLFENKKRRKKQSKRIVKVIIGNPPYSAGQKSANDNNQNQKYPELDERVRQTYVETSTATNKNSLYDSYIKAFRWASDRIGDRGVIAFVSNGGWLDGNAMDGFRKALDKEFDDIYLFNCRGNQRTSGETSRKEGGKIFGSGSRAPIVITVLVKKGK